MPLYPRRRRLHLFGRSFGRLSGPLTLLLSVCSAAPVLAAPPTSTEKTYRIEAIVFAQPGNDDAGERWPTTAALPPALETLTPASDLPPDAKLLPALQALKPPYRVLAQASWTQVATEKAATKPVALRSTDGSLDGTILFYVSRFLHSEIALRWRPEAVAGTATTATNANGSMPANPAANAAANPPADPQTAAPATPTFRLSERRRIKTAETHYFDHPRFGVLLRVTPL